MVRKYNAVREIVPQLKTKWANMFYSIWPGMEANHREALWVIENFLFENGLFMAGDERITTFGEFYPEDPSPEPTTIVRTF